ncbi:hypothetical protein [Alkaliphilus serpentinus]|nr:hypothetical protein [Alkaliphilus serpentinus]
MKNMVKETCYRWFLYPSRDGEGYVDRAMIKVIVIKRIATA